MYSNLVRLRMIFSNLLKKISDFDCSISRNDNTIIRMIYFGSLANFLICSQFLIGFPSKFKVPSELKPSKGLLKLKVSMPFWHKWSSSSFGKENSNSSACDQ